MSLKHDSQYDSSQVLPRVFDEDKGVLKVQATDGTNDVAINDNGSINVATTYERFLAAISASNWMNLANYDSIVPSIVGNVLTLSYFEDASLLGEAVITDYESLDNWSLQLTRYIDDDTGELLLDDDDTRVFLE